MATSSNYQEINSLSFHAQQHLIEDLHLAGYRKFHRIIRKAVYFNAFFLTIALCELFVLTLGFSFLAQSYILAFSLAFTFLTAFSYFLLRIYLQIKIPEQLKALSQEYIKASMNLLGCEKDAGNDKLGLSHLACEFVAHLYQREYQLYPLPHIARNIEPIVSKLSAWIHWMDVLCMQELLLAASIHEHVQLIKSEPLNVSLHASLAGVYVLLSTLYQNTEQNGTLWIPPGKYSPPIQEKFQQAVNHALQEFEILRDLAPSDPLIHSKLALFYRDLQMPEDEIKEYEILLKLCPSDEEISFRLGELYFKEGYNAKGLKIYEKLKATKHGANLLHLYGCFAPLP